MEVVLPLPPAPGLLLTASLPRLERVDATFSIALAPLVPFAPHANFTTWVVCMVDGFWRCRRGSRPCFCQNFFNLWTEFPGTVHRLCFSLRLNLRVVSIWHGEGRELDPVVHGAGLAAEQAVQDGQLGRPTMFRY